MLVMEVSTRSVVLRRPGYWRLLTVTVPSYSGLVYSLWVGMTGGSGEQEMSGEENLRSI